MALIVGALFGLIVGGALWFVSRGGPAEEEPAGEQPAQGGFGAGFWLVKAIDATVGLPNQTRAYEDHAILASQFLDWIDAGEFEAAYDTLARNFRIGSSAHALKQEWADAIKQTGRPDPIEGERRWHSVEGGSPVYTFAFNRNHNRGSTSSRVGVVRSGDRCMIVSYEVKFRHYRMRVDED